MSVNAPISVLPVSMDKEAPVVLSYEDYISATYPNNFQADSSNFDTDAFKLKTTAGTCLEFFNGRLYFAIENYVYCTKAHDVEHFDIRYNVVAGFDTAIKMIARVVDGLYVATDNNTYFLQGSGPYETNVEGSGFIQKHIMKYGAIYGTVARWQSDLITDAKAQDTTVLWASTIGVVSGSNSGNYKLLSLNQVTMPTGLTGTSMVKEKNGIYQYIVCFNVGSDLFINHSEGVTIDNAALLDTWVVNVNTGMHSRYTNYVFSRFYKFGEDYFGINATGIYKLTGDTDFTGVPNLVCNINSFALTPVTDFNKETLKQISDAFINARVNGSLCVDMTVDETTSYNDNVILYNEIDGVSRRRVKLPRGALGSNWQFKISNIDGCFFKIFDFEILIRALEGSI